MGEFTFILSLMAVGLIAIGLCLGFLWIKTDEPPPWK